MYKRQILLDDKAGLPYSLEILQEAIEKYRRYLGIDPTYGVLGYPGYVVSNLGEIANAKTKRSLEGSWINGYRRVTIQYRGKPVNINPARAVLEAFCGPAPLGKEVDHKNTNRWDNCLENLWWRTHQENMNNSITREKMRKPHKIGKYYDDIPEGI